MFNKKTDKNKALDSNLEYLLSKESKLKEKLEDSGYLEPFSDDLMLFMSLVKDYYKGDYRKIPFKTISAGVVGAIYTLNPIDLIPDSIPFIGHIDDALVLRFCLKPKKICKNTKNGSKNNQMPKLNQRPKNTPIKIVTMRLVLIKKLTVIRKMVTRKTVMKTAPT